MQELTVKIHRKCAGWMKKVKLGSTLNGIQQALATIAKALSIPQRIECLMLPAIKQLISLCFHTYYTVNTVSNQPII